MAAAIPAPRTGPARARATSSDPRPHYVYRLFAEDGSLLYVGMTMSPEKRLNGHRSSTWWFHEVASFSLIGPFVGPNARRRALNRERHLIQTERPKRNRDGGHRERVTPTVEEMPQALLNIAAVQTFSGLAGVTVEDACAAGGITPDDMNERVDREAIRRIARRLNVREGTIAPALSGLFREAAA